MPLVKVLKDWGSSEGYQVGDIVDVSNPAQLIIEGYVEATEEEPREPVAPVTEEPVEEPAPEEPVIEPVAPEPVVETPAEELPKEPAPEDEQSNSASVEGADEN